MRRYWLVVAALLTVLLLLFGVVEALEVPLLTDPAPALSSKALAAAVVGVGLLMADVVLPVPSSLVMLAHGAAFGVVVGAALSLAGSLGAALLGLGLGRRGAALLDRVVPQHERRRADALLARWGTLAIVVTRPVPLLAETTVLLAGASGVGWARTAAAAALGSLPAAVLYALAGAAAADVASTPVVFGLVLMLAAATWLVGVVAGRRGSHEPNRGVA